MVSSNASRHGEFGFSQIPGNPSFRNASVNSVVVIPLMSNGPTKTKSTSTTSSPPSHSIKAFHDLLKSLRKHNYCHKDMDNSCDGSMLLVVPNNSLTRPGDWRYNDTPFSSFHWQHGCQRLSITDGRPGMTRLAHDKLLNPSVSRNWIDLYPYRRTAAVVGVLSLQDCASVQDFHQAEEELRSWCTQYSTPPYAVTLGQHPSTNASNTRDVPVVRMFVYDSFTEGSVDLSNSTYLGSNRIVAFPPSLGGDTNLSTNIHLMNLHLNVVVSDLAVSIFRDLEAKVKEYRDIVSTAMVAAATIASAFDSNSNKQSAARRTIQRFVAATSRGGNTTSTDTSFHSTRSLVPIDDTTSTSATTDDPSQQQQQQQQQTIPGGGALKNLTIGSMASLVNPESKLAKDSPTNASSLGGLSSDSTTIVAASGGASSAISTAMSSNKIPRLLTPFDEESASTSAISGDASRKRDIGRREKWCGDLSLLAGSPLDAYEHYLKAAELLSSKIIGAGSAATNVPASLDPLWHACALEGCAAAHITMADCGGYNVDEYLENNFQLPEEVMVVLFQYQASLEAAAKRNNNSGTGGSGGGTSTGTGGGGASGDTDAPPIPKRVPANKQTLPEVVFTLCEESLAILSRNRNLAHLYAELLLKLARYCSDEAEGHLRCQWGNGIGCYSGTISDDVDGPIGSGGTSNDNVPRYRKTSTSKLLLLGESPRRFPAGMNDMAMMNTVHRTRKVCELLHTAAAISSLTPATRVDVAAQCSVVCLQGVKPTTWKNQKLERTKLPRKAAFFSSVAAEAMCLANQPQKCRDFWLLPTQLYSRNPNPSNGFISGTYGWASLRAYCLEALSMQGNSRVSLESSLELLSLLSELQPIKRPTAKGTTSQPAVSSDQTLATPKIKNVRTDDPAVRYDDSSSSLNDNSEPERTGGAGTGLRSDFGLSLDETEIREAVANAARNLRDNYRITLASASALLSNQLKTADGEQISMVSVPFSDLATLPSGLMSLNSVWPHIEYEACVYAQKHCMDRIATLRRSLPTMSGFEADPSSIYGSDGQKLPLYVTSAMAIQAESALEMECVKKVIGPDKSKEGAMATFYNPFEAKKKQGNESTIRVAEEEERAMLIKFGNKLSLPLEVRRSQLEFENDVDGRLKAASLSFIIPARAKGFTVQFPFTILSKKTESDEGQHNNSAEFEVKGLDLTCFGRSFFLPIKELSDTTSPTRSANLPESASLYPYRSVKKSSTELLNTKPRVETFPCQPRLHVMYADTCAPVDRIAVGLSDGEIYSLPKVRLENYMGPSGQGKIERLQIFSVNVPLMSDKKLYDSASSPVEIIDEADFVKDLIWKENSPPLLLRLQGGSLNLESINGADDSTQGDDNTFTFQIAAAHNLGEKMKRSVNLCIRFRYRGLSSTSTEVWRKKEIILQIRHVKGPRISSVAFRHDLAIESALAEMGQAPPLYKPDKMVRKMTTIEDRLDTESEFPLLSRVGLDNEIGICGDKSYFVLTVANETKSVLSLERAGGPVGGFENSPLQTITVRPGVSAKIPFAINRLSRIDENGRPVDVISELVARTSLIWKSHRGGEAGPVKARGNIRIPPACLKDIIGRYPSFLSHVCEAPCSIRLFVGNPVDAKSELRIGLGMPVDVSVEVDISSWVPKNVVENCTLTIEFRCGRKRLHGTNSFTTGKNTDYCWGGKLRHSMPMNTVDKKHRAKIIFCSQGRYAVSACAKISHRGSACEESWWAPIAQSVVVEECIGQ